MPSKALYNGAGSWCDLELRVGARGSATSIPQKWRSRFMLRTVGFLMQLAVLALLPMLIVWQLMFGFRLILMPMLTLVGIVVFTTGQWLREGNSR